MARRARDAARITWHGLLLATFLESDAEEFRAGRGRIPASRFAGNPNPGEICERFLQFDNVRYELIPGFRNQEACTGALPVRANQPNLVRLAGRQWRQVPDE